jgi:hypothetical protein
MTLPIIFPENDSLLTSNTVVIRNNTITDCYATLPVTAIEVNGNTNCVLKYNKIARVNNPTFASSGFAISNCQKLFMQYNAVGRCSFGLQIHDVSELYVYNYTAHNCVTGILTNSSGTFRNIALSAGVNTKYYQTNIGFYLLDQAIINADYLYYFNVGDLKSGSGTLTIGENVKEEEILYFDEPNDNYVPDHISEIVNSGTENLLRETTVDIGGIVSEIVDESTADRLYHYDLIDNAFWDVDNQKAVEIAFIKAFQSRIMANSEVANTSVVNNTYLKTADSLTRFTELYPMYSRYCSAMQFKKRVMDLWYAGQNVGTAQAYQSAIGGYNLLPSFLKRLEDFSESWVVGESYIDVDNYLLGTDEHKFGIGIDVLGWSTLTLATSAECYRNVMNSVADIAPVYWVTHDEVQPSGYLVFAHGYNEHDNCTLQNMMYSDEYTIVVNDIGQVAQLETPVLLLNNVLAVTEGTATSGQVELSVLDRIYSENVDRTIYYRLGTSVAMLTPWQAVNKTVGEVLQTDGYNAVQFKIIAENLVRQIDYEFISLALRGYTSSRIWDMGD